MVRLKSTGKRLVLGDDDRHGANMERDFEARDVVQAFWDDDLPENSGYFDGVVLEVLGARAGCSYAHYRVKFDDGVVDVVPEHHVRRASRPDDPSSAVVPPPGSKGGAGKAKAGAGADADSTAVAPKGKRRKVEPDGPGKGGGGGGHSGAGKGGADHHHHDTASGSLKPGVNSSGKAAARAAQQSQAAPVCDGVWTILDGQWMTRDEGKHEVAEVSGGVRRDRPQSHKKGMGKTAKVAVAAAAVGNGNGSLHGKGGGASAERGGGLANVGKPPKQPPPSSQQQHQASNGAAASKRGSSGGDNNHAAGAAAAAGAGSGRSGSGQGGGGGGGAGHGHGGSRPSGSGNGVGSGGSGPGGAHGGAGSQQQYIGIVPGAGHQMTNHNSGGGAGSSGGGGAAAGGAGVAHHSRPPRPPSKAQLFASALLPEVYSKPSKDRMDGFALEQRVKINDSGTPHHGKLGVVKVLPRHPGSFFQIDVLPDPGSDAAGQAAAAAAAKQAASKRGRDDDAAVVKNEYIRFRAKNLLDATPLQPPPLLVPALSDKPEQDGQTANGVGANVGHVVDLTPASDLTTAAALDAQNASILSGLMQTQAPVSLN